MTTLLWALQSVLPLVEPLLPHPQLPEGLRTPATHLLLLLQLSQLTRKGVSQLLPRNYTTAPQDQFFSSIKERLEGAELMILHSCSSIDVYERCCGVACLTGLGAGLVAWTGSVPGWVDMMVCRVECLVMEMAARAGPTPRHGEPTLVESGQGSSIHTDENRQDNTEAISVLGMPETLSPGHSDFGQQQLDLLSGSAVATDALFKACLGIAVGEISSRYGRTWQLTASPIVLDCLLTALLDFCLPLDGVFLAANKRATVAAANEWLAAHARGPLELPLWSLTRAAGGLVSRLSEMEKLSAVQRVWGFAVSLHNKYTDYLLGTSSAWVRGVDAGLAGMMLGRAFHCSVELLSNAGLDGSGGIQDQSQDSSRPLNLPGDCQVGFVPLGMIWQGMAEQQRVENASTRPDHSQMESVRLEAPTHITVHGAIVLMVLDSVAHLQFCRVPSSGYSRLLQTAIGCATASEARVGALVLLPSYDAIVATGGETGTPAQWNRDPMLASRMVFLMRVFPALLKTFQASPGSDRLQGPDPLGQFRGGAAGCVESLAPFAFLFLHHHDPNLRKSTHKFFSVLVDAAWESGAVHLIELLAPFYVHRSLERAALLPVDPFSLSLATILRRLPGSSPAGRRCIDELTSAVRQAGAQRQHPQRGNAARAGAASGVAVPQREKDDAALRLFEILCRCALWVPVDSLASLTGTIEGVLRDWQDGSAQYLAEPMGVLHGIVAGNKDYTRRLALVRWYISLSSRM